MRFAASTSPTTDVPAPRSMTFAIAQGSPTCATSSVMSTERAKPATAQGADDMNVLTAELPTTLRRNAGAAHRPLLPPEASRDPQRRRSLMRAKREALYLLVGADSV